jgi:holliday junction DNA helicase RuvA
MIVQIKGKLVEKNPSSVVVETNDGLGHEVQISLYTNSKIPHQENIFLFVEQIIREDVNILYGFSSKEERRLFQLLITVSGVGANTARMVLSYLEPLDVVHAILNEDVNAIKSVKGIGAKTAQRIIVDLKDKVAKENIISGEEVSISISNNKNKNEALVALQALGFALNAAEKAVNKTLKSMDESATVEDIIKSSLKNF